MSHGGECSGELYGRQRTTLRPLLSTTTTMSQPPRNQLALGALQFLIRNTDVLAADDHLVTNHLRALLTALFQGSPQLRELLGEHLLGVYEEGPSFNLSCTSLF